MPFPEPDDDLDAPPTPPSGARPNWLVGADEGANAEMSRDGEPDDAPPLRLIRPDADMAQQGGGAPRPSRPEPPAGMTSAAKPWVAAASSVPRLRLTPAAASARREPEPAFEDEEPMSPEPYGSGAQPRPLDVADAFPDDDVVEKAAARVQLRPLKESFWVVALDELRSNSKVQILVALVALSLVTFAMWPRKDAATSLHTVRSHASEWDGRTVSLRGRVGEVFAVGGGYTFYLHQGRDTIVVFTRSRVPVERENVSVTGSISTGYLDGRPRQTLFEATR
jgi:hypothetical protein